MGCRRFFLSPLMLAACTAAGLAATPSETRPATTNSAALYTEQLHIPYSAPAGKPLFLNAFLPSNAVEPTPAIVFIHGGWWSGGAPPAALKQVPGYQTYANRQIAVFTISYRLGREGGFPENIRDCRNAIRFLRLHAKDYHIDPDRIGVTGASAGGHLCLMVAMVPENFDDGGPTEGLENVSAKVCTCFSWIPVTDFIKEWNDGPSDVITQSDGTTTFRPPDPKIPNDARPIHRILFHGIVPETEEGKTLYHHMSPIAYVRKDLPPLLICDGEKDLIVPGYQGELLYEALKSLGADATYYMTPNGGHHYPAGSDFQPLLEKFIDRTLMAHLPNEQK